MKCTAFSVSLFYFSNGKYWEGIYLQYGADNSAIGTRKLYEYLLVHTWIEFPECLGITVLSSSLLTLVNKWSSEMLTSLNNYFSMCHLLIFSIILA